MPEKQKTQLAVIGGGPGGYAAAFHAATLGLEVTLINAETAPGGVCLHRGCIPSKALLHIAKLLNETREAAEWGVQFKPPSVDLARLREWKNGVIGQLASGIEKLCEARGVRLLRARAVFTASDTLQLVPASAGAAEGIPEFLEFERAILAAGSLPFIPPALRVEDPRVMDSSLALDLPEIPGSLLVVGGGYIGLEMGAVYASLGSLVTVVELSDGLLPGADRDLVRPLQARLKRNMAAIHLNTKVESLAPGEKGVLVKMTGPEGAMEQRFDRVLISVGRRPNTANLGVENTQIQLDSRGFARVDRQMRTTDPNIWAIGDLAGEPMLAHKATREAKVAVEVIAGQNTTFDSLAIPAVVFTDPEVAWVGLTESGARAAGRKVSVSRFPWSASGRAITMGRGDGLTKLLFDPETDRLLGVGIVGAGAGDLISEAALALEMGAVAQDVAATIHPHPTLSETVAESAEAHHGQATHLFRPRRPEV